MESGRTGWSLPPMCFYLTLKSPKKQRAGAWRMVKKVACLCATSLAHAKLNILVLRMLLYIFKDM